MATILKDKSNYLTNDQVEAMIQHTQDPQVQLLVLLLWRTGRRVSELLKLKPQDIDFSKSIIGWHILKKHRKPDQQDFLAVDSHTLALIKEYCKHYNIEDTEYIFLSPRRRRPGTGKKRQPAHLTRKWAFEKVRDLANKAKIRYRPGKKLKSYEREGDLVTITPVAGWHPHHFRHSFAINFLNQADSAAALVMLQRQLAHSSIMITQAYLEFSQADRVAMLNKVFKV